MSLTFNNTIGLFDNRLEIRTGLLYTHSKTDNNGLYPLPDLPAYGRFVEADGSPAAIPRYNPGFLDRVGQGRLLDWAYRPLDELALGDFATTLSDLQVNLTARYRLSRSLTFSALYQYANGNSGQNTHHHEHGYFARDLINQFSSIAPNGEVIRPVPLGGILDVFNQQYGSHKGRGQLDFAHTWAHHGLNLMADAEISNRVSTSNSGHYYGYRAERPAGTPVDGVNLYTSSVTGWQSLQIAQLQGLTHLSDRFISFYGMGSDNLINRYILSGSVRRDGSNLFGVRTNQQWNPLWSGGLKWVIDRESFYDIGLLPDLAARLTFGSSGNIDKSVTAYLTARNAGNTPIGLPILTINTPPNPDLLWETVSMLNAAIDFALLRTGRINGSIEWFKKWGRDLMSDAELSAITGLTKYRGNTASLETRGMDITLNARHLDGPLSWQSTLLLNGVDNRVTEYRITPTTNATFINGALLVGKPLESQYAYRWAA